MWKIESSGLGGGFDHDVGSPLDNGHSNDQLDRVPQGRLKIGDGAILDNLQPSLRDLVNNS
jgi:hypothetical protein